MAQRTFFQEMDADFPGAQDFIDYYMGLLRSNESFECDGHFFIIELMCFNGKKITVKGAESVGV